jgi:hypothetical protein
MNSFPIQWRGSMIGAACADNFWLGTISGFGLGAVCGLSIAALVLILCATK